jgi:hypothetical protein
MVAMSDNPPRDAAPIPQCAGDRDPGSPSRGVKEIPGESARVEVPTGPDQARINRENDPPA